MRRALVLGILLFAVLPFAALSQDAQPQSDTPHTGSTRPKIYTIAVNVQSKDPRVKGISNQLVDEAAAEVERGAKNVRSIVVVGTKGEAAEQARRRNADYMLTIEFSPESNASIEFGPGMRHAQDPEVYGPDRAKMQGQMFLAWTVDPMNGNKVRLHDSRYVRPAEYPLPGATPGGVVGWDWVASIASRSVRDAAIAAMSKLKLRKGIPLELTVKGEHGH